MDTTLRSSTTRARALRIPMLLAGLACLVCIATVPGCGNAGQAGDGRDSEPSAEAASPSQVTADSLGVAGTDSASMAAADSAQAEPEESGGGFFANLFGRGRDEEEEKEDESVPVELVDVAVQDMPAYLSTTATLQPEKEADVLAKIDGEIRRILVEEGDWVNERQVLAELDGARQQVELEEAEARCRALRLDLERTEALKEQELASEKDLHDAQAQFDQAAAQRKAVQLQVDYTQIRAPFAGQVTQRYVDPGQTVATGTKILALVDRDPLLAEIHVPEKQAGRIVPGQDVVISPDTDLTRSAPGQVLRVAPIVDARTGTVKITCQVSDYAQTLRPGSFVRVQVRTDMRTNVLAIPKRALLPEGGETYVFCAEADSVRKVAITTGLTNHTLVEVTSGLEEGDRVVTVGHGALKTGSKIRAIEPDQTAVADSSPGQAALH